MPGFDKKKTLGANALFCQQRLRLCWRLTEEPEPREDGRGSCYPARIHPLLIYSVGRAATDSQGVPPLGTALPNAS